MVLVTRNVPPSSTSIPEVAEAGVLRRVHGGETMAHQGQAPRQGRVTGEATAVIRALEREVGIRRRADLPRLHLEADRGIGRPSPETPAPEQEIFAGIAIKEPDEPEALGLLSLMGMDPHLCLPIMAGGAAPDVARVLPVLQAYGRPVHLGPLGAGEVAKACNQLIVAATILALGEAAVLADRSGLDVPALFTLLEGGYADSRLLRTRGRSLAAEDYTPAGAARYLVKDLGFGTDEFDRVLHSGLLLFASIAVIAFEIPVILRDLQISGRIIGIGTGVGFFRRANGWFATTAGVTAGWPGRLDVPGACALWAAVQTGSGEAAREWYETYGKHVLKCVRHRM